MKKIITTIIFTLTIVLGNARVFTLCEGNYGTPNASLWSINQNFDGVTGPIYWNENTNPLGDTGQSMTVVNDEKLYIVMNNSHSIEVLNLDGYAQSFLTSIPLPSAGPRYLIANGNTGYVSCWNLSAILVLDLAQNTVTDTIAVGGMPEMMVMHGGKIYTSIAMNSDWSSSDRVISIDVSTKAVVDTFTVVSGPAALLLQNNALFVASTYYDDIWNTYAGNSKIDLSTGIVSTFDAGMTFDFGLDLLEFNNQVYRIYNGGIAPLSEDLSIDVAQQIGNFSGLYSASDGNNLYFGLTDYVAPDDLIVTDLEGNQLAQYNVGALPGSFAFAPASSVSIDDTQIPKAVSILSNYPNPFNPATTIRFSVETQEIISLHIYDISGKLVETLFVDAQFNNGNHAVQWNGNDVSSGIYFAILKNSEHIWTKKMTLMK